MTERTTETTEREIARDKYLLKYQIYTLKCQIYTLREQVMWLRYMLGAMTALGILGWLMWAMTIWN
jgi:hypothetical protein